jgi:hypothetical protein
MATAAARSTGPTRSAAAGIFAAPVAELVSATADPAGARDVARQILSGRRYQGAPVPRPLHALLRWFGDRITSITRWIGDRFSWVPSWAVPIVRVAAILIVAALITWFVTAVVRANARSRAARLAGTGGAGPARALDDPAALEAAAAQAEARGDLALAVRLRFRAGLVRLDRDAHAIAYRPSIPTVAVRSELALPAFDELADTFESITYGSTPAEPANSDDARREWPRVVAAARKR